MVNNINVKQVRKIVNNLLLNPNDNSTYIVSLTTMPNAYYSDGTTWALVLAWQDGFADSSDSPLDRQICGKVAYNDSCMKEYDIDWLMPYDENTAEVYDTECSIMGYEDVELAVDYWNDCWKEIRKNLPIEKCA